MREVGVGYLLSARIDVALQKEPIMPIVAKHIIEARRAAAAEAAAAAVAVAAPEPVSNGLSGENGSAMRSGEEPSTPPGPKRRGHAVRNERGKYQPTSDYPEGFARPPERHQFKPGCAPGPGRPRGSVSHDTLIAKHLNEKREISIRGERKKLATRELVVMSTVKSALEGKDKHARAYILAQHERLFPARESSADAANPATLSASDELSLAEYEQELRERLRDELMAELRGQTGEAR